MPTANWFVTPEDARFVAFDGALLLRAVAAVIALGALIATATHLVMRVPLSSPHFPGSTIAVQARHCTT